MGSGKPKLGWKGNDLVLVRNTVIDKIRLAPVLMELSDLKKAHVVQWIAFSQSPEEILEGQRLHLLAAHMLSSPRA